MSRLRAVAILAFGLLGLVRSCDDPTAPDTCIAGRTLEIGGSVTENVAPGDCVSGDDAYDVYHFTLATQTIIKFVVTGTGVNPVMVLTNDGKTAPNNEIFLAGTATTTTEYAILPAGTYTLGVRAGEGADTGPYTLASTIVPAPGPVGCVKPQQVAVTQGINVSGALTDTDCKGTTNLITDAFFIEMHAGGTYVVTFTTTFAVHAEIDFNGAVLVPLNSATAGTVTTTYHPTVSGTYLISINSNPVLTTGTYTFKVE